MFLIGRYFDDGKKKTKVCFTKLEAIYEFLWSCKRHDRVIMIYTNNKEDY